MLPASSQKVVDYNWPVIFHYAEIQVNKGYSTEKVLEVMQDYLANKPFLVRERKALYEKVKELFYD